jgi:hypothetical protein
LSIARLLDAFCVQETANEKEEEVFQRLAVRNRLRPLLGGHAWLLDPLCVQ